LIEHIRYRHPQIFETIKKDAYKEIHCPCGKQIEMTQAVINPIIISNITNEPNNLPKFCCKKCDSNFRPPWNSELTKHDHPSIMKLSEDRMGENNPIHTWIHDEEKKEKWAQKISENHPRLNAGKTCEEIYGEEKAYIIKQKMSAKQKIRPKEPHKGHKHSLETRQLLSRLTAQQISNQKSRITKPQLALYDELCKHYSNVILEHPIVYYCIDIVVNDRFLIEVDGDFYHSNEKLGYDCKYQIQIDNRANDIRKNKFFEDRKDQYTLLRFWASDITNDVHSVVDQIKKVIDV